MTPGGFVAARPGGLAGATAPLQPAVAAGLAVLAVAAGLACLSMPWPWLAASALTLALAGAVFLHPDLLGFPLLALLVIVVHEQPFFAFATSWSTRVIVPIPSLAIDKLSVPTLILTAALLSRFALDRAAGLRPPLLPCRLRLPSILILLWAALSLTWTDNVRHGVLTVITFATALAIFHCALNVLQDAAAHRRAMWWIAGAGVLQAAIAYAARAQDSSTYLVLLEAGFGRLFFAIPGGTFNLPGLGYSQHDLALTSNFANAVIIGLAATEARRSRKILLACCFLFIFSALLLTMSRTGVASGLLAMHLLLFALLRFRRTAIRKLAFFYPVAVGIFLLQLKLIGEKGSPRLVSEGNYSIGARLEIWGLGFEHWLRSPVWGLGAGGYTNLAQPAPHAHSFFFAHLFDLGLPGLLFVLGVVWYFLKKVPDALRHQSGYAATMRLALTGALVSTFMHSLIDFNYNAAHLWFIIGTAAATFLLAEREAGQPPHKQPAWPAR